MLPFTQWFDQDLQDAVKVHHCESVVFSGDADSVQIGVRLTNGGTAVSLSGETCIGYVIRGDFATVGPINCTVSNNAVSMLLNQSALACDGVIGVSIKVGTITVLKAIFGTEPTTTDTLVDPGHVIPSIEELLAQIDKMEDAISRGNAAAELCEGMTVAATAVAGNTPTVTKATNYNAVTPASGANPKELGYYEYSDGAYVLTEDTTVQDGKTYYVGTFGLTFGLVPASISNQVAKYQVSSSGTTIPTGTWQDTVPTVPQGDFLWTQYTITWGNAQTSVLYSVARQGIDGSGAVSTVNNISPDANGNVDLGALVKSVNGNTPDSNGAVTVPVDATPTASSTNPVQSGGVKSAIDQINATIAIVEDGDNATQTIDAGAFVLWQGDLYTADASIPSGDPFAASGGSKNLTAVPNGGLNALNRPNPVLYYRYADGAGSHTFTIANNARLLLISTDSSVNSQGIWFIITTGAGVVVKKDVIAASDITLNTATANKLKITVAGFTRLKFEDLSGGNVAEKVSE